MRHVRSLSPPLFALTAGAAVAGCMIRVPLESPARFDGTYAGAAQFASGGPGCGRAPVPHRVVIRDGTATLDDGGHRAAVDGNGGFGIADPPAGWSFEGQVIDGAIVGRMARAVRGIAESCVDQLRLVKVGV